MGLLQDRVVLVSGVGRGLGYQVVAAVLREGGQVALGDRFSHVYDLQKELDPSGDRSLAAVCDITDHARCDGLIGEVAARFGRLDGLVHVAAADRIFGGLLDGSLEDWDLAASVNVKGTLALTRAAVPLLQADGGGSVVVVGSIGAVLRDANFDMLAYGASKGALRTAAWYLSRELGPLGIRVNTVAPGYKWGPVLEGALQEQADARHVELEEVVAPIRDGLALRRIPTDADVANVVVFLCSSYSNGVTGETVHIDGGMGDTIH
jgi:NAD(P)-dependent dehydrogenase (short-subunit alcohol dehydrogenase family)